MLARYYNDAVIALDQLYDEAIHGSTAAEELLRVAADNLLRAAGETRRLYEHQTAVPSHPSEEECPF
jgi:hypothetical protein